MTRDHEEIRKDHPGGPGAPGQAVRAQLSAGAMTTDDACLEGIRFYQAKRLDDAAEIFRQVLEADPCHARAMNALAVIACDQADYETSLALLQRLLAAHPAYEKGYNTRGLVLLKRERLDEAFESFSRAIALNPSFAEAYGNLGDIHMRQKRWDEALACYRKILKLDPDSFMARYQEGIALNKQGMKREALESFQAVLARKPDFLDAYAAMGAIFHEAGLLRETVAAYEGALGIKPDAARFINFIGTVLLVHGQVDAAIEKFRLAFARDPDDVKIHSNLILAQTYAGNCTPEEILEESRKWEHRHACERVGTGHGTGNAPVRIGYVSPDFRGHVIMYFFSPLLAFHDRSRFRIYCYADVDTPDATSRWVETMADSWVPSAGMSDAELAEKIVADGIDILVDLSGHTASNRLRLFTMKPAPVQVSWLGYPATTGLSAMDYRISDRVADPVGVTDRFHSETVIRLSGRFLCYCPDAKPPDVSPLPARANGWVTFGSFNNLAKISPDVLSLWGKLLRSIPDARLFLKSRYFADAVTRERCYAVLEAEGVDRGRIRLAPFVPGSHGHMASYAEMDISLDPFPYNGTTTTCESLWMGVPVITLAGGHHAARVGASLLTGIGMDELVASSREEYLGIAARLAGDVERLALLRKQLRQRVAQSPICDARGFARDMEEAFLVMRDNVTQRRDHATGSGK